MSGNCVSRFQLDPTESATLLPRSSSRRDFRPRLGTRTVVAAVRRHLLCDRVLLGIEMDFGDR